MASIEEVTAGIRAVLDQLATARADLARTATPIEEAGRSYALLGVGSQQSALADSAAHLRAAYDKCRQVVAMLDQITERADAYLAAIGGKPIAPAGSEPTPPNGPAPEPWALDYEQVEALRRELPPPITVTERGTGRKTHGRWVAADGQARKITSGEDRFAPLLAGCSLTVHAPNYRRTFTGGARP